MVGDTGVYRYSPSDYAKSPTDSSNAIVRLCTQWASPKETSASLASYTSLRARMKADFPATRREIEYASWAYTHSDKPRRVLIHNGSHNKEPGLVTDEMKFSLFPIEGLARSWENGGFYDGDLTDPFSLLRSFRDYLLRTLKPSSFRTNSIIYQSLLGVKFLRAIKYVIINRYPQYGQARRRDDLRGGATEEFQIPYSGSYRVLTPHSTASSVCTGVRRDIRAAVSVCDVRQFLEVPEGARNV